MAALSKIRIHTMFRWALWLKGIFAMSEIAGGVAVGLVSQGLVVRLVDRVTGFDLSRNPEDIIANYLQQLALQFGEIRHFAAMYLLMHGVVKMWLIVQLLRERIGFYPVALLVFGFFVVYQVYRFSLTQSWLLLLITLLDLVVMLLTWKEYQLLRSHRRGW